MTNSNPKSVAVPAMSPVPVSRSDEGAAFISIIERAARDPSVDIDKMERLFEMHERVSKQRAKSAYLEALAAMQPEMPIVEKRGEIKKNAKDEHGAKTGGQDRMTGYAKWEDVVEAITPILFKHGFSISFRTAFPTPDRVLITGVLGHREGHTEETVMSLPFDNTGAKNNLQGWGSSVSYGKRYTAFALLNIAARDEDDDGRAADPKTAPVSEEQIGKLREAMDEASVSIPKFCDHFKISKLSDLPASKFDSAMQAIATKKKGSV